MFSDILHDTSSIISILKILLSYSKRMNNNQSCVISKGIIVNIISLMFRRYLLPTLLTINVSCTIKLNDWWCNCREFQALGLFCPHVILVYYYYYLQLITFSVPPIQHLQDLWSSILFDSNWERLTTNHIHNEMDQPM